MSKGAQFFEKLVDAKHRLEDRVEYERGWNEAIEACRAAQPCTAEKPRETSYDYGYFRGVIDYGKAIIALRRVR